MHTEAAQPKNSSENKGSYMTLAREIAPHLPLLRRHARALTGAQESGDAFVAATLEAIVARPAEFPASSTRAPASTRCFIAFGKARTSK